MKTFKPFTIEIKTPAEAIALMGKLGIGAEPEYLDLPDSLLSEDVLPLLYDADLDLWRRVGDQFDPADWDLKDLLTARCATDEVALKLSREDAAAIRRVGEIFADV